MRGCGAIVSECIVVDTDKGRAPEAVGLVASGAGVREQNGRATQVNRPSNAGAGKLGYHCNAGPVGLRFVPFVGEADAWSALVPDASNQPQEDLSTKGARKRYGVGVSPGILGSRSNP